MQIVISFRVKDVLVMVIEKVIVEALLHQILQ